MDVNQQAQLYMIRGAIASLPDEQQTRVRASADRLRAILKEDGGEGLMALCLVTLEQAAP